MNMRRMLAGVVAATAVTAAIGLSAGTAGAATTTAMTPSQPQAANCWEEWHDAWTVGVECTGVQWFYALAHCANGQWVNGATSAPGTVSYAYCSSVYSTQVGYGWVHP